MRWKVTIEVRPVMLFPPSMILGADTTQVEVVADSRLGAFSQAVLAVLGAMRSGMGELLGALRELRQEQAKPSAPSQPSVPAPTKASTSPM